MPATTAPAAGKTRAEYLTEYEECAASALRTLDYAEDNHEHGSPEYVAAVAHAGVVAQLATAAATAALAAKD